MTAGSSQHPRCEIRPSLTRQVTEGSLNNQSAKRRGSVLILVMVVIAMLTLGAYSFSEIMISESEATAMYGRQAESRAFADSGVELAAAVIAAPETEEDASLYHNPNRFRGVLLRESENARGRGYFSVIAPRRNRPRRDSCKKRTDRRIRTT